jgi:hypothetical protein
MRTAPSVIPTLPPTQLTTLTVLQRNRLASRDVASHCPTEAIAENRHYRKLAPSARDGAKNETDRARLTLVMAFAYSALEHWPELLSCSQELIKTEPTSVLAFNLIVIAYKRLKRFDDWQQTGAREDEK